MPVPVGWIKLLCSDPPTTLVVRLGEERPDVTAGYGGWEEVARPRRTGIVVWSGVAVRRLSLSLLFDQWQAGVSVEGDIATLEALARPRRGGTPPSLRIDAAGGHLPYKGLLWVIDTLEWGDALMNAYGNRTRQAVAVNLIEYVSDALVEEKSPANKRRSKASGKSGKNSKKGASNKRQSAARSKHAKPKTKAHTRSALVEPGFDGEDLASIAARELGDGTRWREIADLNGIRDPRAVSVGQVLRLP